MKIEDVLSPKELQTIFENETPDTIAGMENLLSDDYIFVIYTNVGNSDQAAGIYRALTYIALHLSKKVIQ